MTRCTDHCSTCGRHFRSVEAFDLHRTGSYSRGVRRCKDPARVKGLAVVEPAGRCDARGRLDGVEVWGTA